MSEFDLDSYNTLLPGNNSADTLETPEVNLDDYKSLGEFKSGNFIETQRNKLLQLQEASRLKKEKLAGTTVGRLGLDPESGAGFVANSGMRAVDTVGRMIGEARTAPSNAFDSLRERLVGNKILQAAERKAKGTATQEDLDLLAQDSSANFSEDPQNLTEAAQMFMQAPLGVPMLADAAISNLRGMTNQERVDAITESRKETAEIRAAFDIAKKYVYTGATDKFNEDLVDGGAKEDLKAVTDTYDAVASGKEGGAKKVFTDALPALASLIANAGSTAADNPQAAAEYVIENLPQLAVGVLGKGALTTTNVSYALDYHNKGVLAYQEANNGALPSGEAAQKLALKAASLALAEQLGELGTLKTLGAFGTGANKTAKSFAKDVAARGANFVGSTTGEAVTEGIQTYVENSLEGKESTPEDIYTGATIGAIASAGTTAPGTVLGITGNSLRAGATAYKTAADNILNAAGAPGEQLSPEQELNVAKAKAQLAKAKLANSVPEKQELIAKQLEEKTAELAATKDPAQKKALETQINYLNEMVVKPNEAQHLEKRANAATEAAAKAEVRHTNWINERNKKGDIRETVDQAIQKTDSTVEGQADKIQEAKSSVMDSVVKAPETFTADTLDELASSPNFAPEEQSYLRKLASHKRSQEGRADVTADEAYTDATTGLEGSSNISLVEHEAAIDAAFAGGNVAEATSTIKRLAKFAEAKRNKLEAMTAAYSRFTTPGTEHTSVPQQIIPVNGQWVPADRQMTRAELNKAKGLEVTTATKGILNKVKNEAEVLAFSEELANERLSLFTTPKTAKPKAPAKAAVTPAKDEVKAKPKPKSESKAEPVIPERVKRLSDAELNDRLEAITPKDPEFAVLNAEMTLREDDAYKEMQKEEATAAEDGATIARKALVERFSAAPVERIAKAVTSRRNSAKEAAKTDAQKAEWLNADADALQKLLDSRQKVEPTVKSALSKKELQGKIRLLGRLQNALHSGAPGENQAELEGLDIAAISAEVIQNLEENDYGLTKQEVALQILLSSSTGLITKKQIWDWVKTLDKPAPHLKKLLQALFKSNLVGDLKGFTSYTSDTAFEGVPYIARGTTQTLKRRSTQTTTRIIGLNLLGNGENTPVLEVIVHEVIHAATRDAIETDALLAGDINEVQQEIKKWLAANGKTLSAQDLQDLKYATKNPHELLTMALTNVRVAALLDKIVLPSKATAFEKLAQAILEFFRRSGEFKAEEMSALARTLNLADLALNGAVEITTETKAAKQETVQQQTVAEPVVDNSFEDDVVTAEASFLGSLKEAVQEEAVSERRTNEISPYLDSTEGILDVFTRASEGEVTAENYKAVNILAKMFKQVGARPDSTTPRSLVAVKDFMSALLNGDVEPKDFVNRSVTEQQQNLLEYFANNYQVWANALNKLLALDTNAKGVQYTDYRHQNAMQFLMDESGQVEENVQTAIITVAMEFLKDKINAGNSLSSREINGMIGRDKKAYVSNQLQTLLDGVIGTKNNMDSSFGKQIFDALGIVAKDGSTLSNEQARMEGAIGAVVPVLLEQLGLIQPKTVWAHAINNAVEFWLEGGSTKNTEANKGSSIAFYELTRTEDTAGIFQDIKEAFKGTGSFFADLFGIESKIAYPTDKPAKFKKVSLANGKQKVNALVKKVANTLNKQAYQARPEVLNILFEDRSFFESLAGISDITEADAHIDMLETAQAKVENERTEIDKMEDALLYMEQNHEGKMLGDFFLEVDPWKVNRMGYLSSVINMQTSKIHRFVFKKASWKATIPLDGNSKLLQSFKLRVMEGLNAKTDNGADAKHLAEWKYYAADPVYVAAATALRKARHAKDNKAELTEEDKAAILAGVTKGKNKLHSLEALMAMSAYLEARENKAATFDTTLSAEIDGKTNGVMLSNWLLGTMTRSLGEKGGFFTKKAGHTHFSSWKAGKNDIYEHLMVVSGRNINENMRVGGKDFAELMRSVYALTGKLVDENGQATSAGRNALKDPLIALNYGSGISRAKEAMGEAFLQRVYETLVSISKGGEYEGKTGQGALELFEYDLNELVRARNVEAYGEIPDLSLMPKQKFFSFRDPVSAIKTRFTTKQMSLLMQSHQAVVGDPIGEAMRKELKEYINVRKKLVASSNLSFAIYNTVYTAVRKAYIENLIDKKKIATYVTKEKDEVTGETIERTLPIYELTKAQEKEVLDLVAAMEPRINSASSQDSGLDAGFFLAGTANKASTARPFEGRFTYLNQEGNKTTVGTKGYHRILTKPGVTIMSNGVQGTDGDIMMRTLQQFDAVGVHDAIMLGVAEAQAAGLALNEQTFDSLVNYSLPMEAYKALERSLLGLEFVLERWGNAEQVKGIHEEIQFHLAEYAATLTDYKPENHFGTSASSVLHQMFSAALSAERSKLSGLGALTSIDQYTMQEAAWKVTEDAIKKANDALDALPTEVDPKTFKRIERLDKIIRGAEVEGGQSRLIERLEQERDQARFGDSVHPQETETAQEDSAEDYVDPSVLGEDTQVDELNAPPTPLPPGIPTSSLQVYEALGHLPNPVTYIADNARLRELLANFIPKLYGPFEQMYASAQQAFYANPEDVFLSNVALGNTPFFTDVEMSPLQMGDQMGYVAELVQQIVGSSLSDLTTTAQNELSKLFEEARATVDPLSLDKDPVTSQEIYDFIFTIPKGDTTAQYLSRFAALGLVHPTVVAALGFDTTKAEDAQPKTLYGKLLNWFKQVMDYFNAGLGKAYGGQRANEKLRVIVDRIVELEANRIARAQVTSFDQLQEQLGEATEGFSEKFRGKIASAARTDFFTKSTSAFIRTGGDIVAKVAEHRVDEIIDGLAYFYNKSVKGRAGALAELANEMRATTNDKKWGHLAILLAKLHEKIRKEVSGSVTKAALQGFANEGVDLTAENKSELTNVLLRTEVFSLLEANQFELVDLLELLENPTKLAQAIAAVTSTITGPHRDYYINQAQHTANYMTTGMTTSENLVRNATALAYLDGATMVLGSVTQADAEAVIPALDKLITLHALAMTNAGQKASVATILREELNRADNGNGIELMLKLAEHNRDKALKDNFYGNPRLMEKGHVPTIVDPRVETKIVSSYEIAGLKAQGWKYDSEISVDPVYGTGKQHRMILRRGLRHRLTGTLGLNSLKAKGQSALITDNNEVSSIFAAKAMDIRKLARPQPNLDLTGYSPNFLAPLFNDSGDVVGYRYTASHKALRDIYKHNNEFDTLLGSAASAIYSKVVTEQQNDTIIEGLHKQWTAQEKSRPDDYIYVGPKSKDPEILQSYALLPESTRKQIEQVWGGKGMMVRRDMYNMHFGYRKYGLAEMIEKNPQDRKAIEQIFTWIVKDVFMLGDKAAQRVNQAQDIWEALVKEIKDFLVIKTGATLFWNIVSNLTLLWLRGVPLTEIARSHRVAFKGALKWDKDITELRQLKALQSAGYKGNVKDLEHRIARLESEMHRNPVRELIEAGLMPSIVEDVEEDEQEYNYRSDLVAATEKVTQHIPKVLRDVGKQLYLTHDTTVYKVLSQGTQLSDFVARYTLYKHETERKRNPLSHIDAVLSASDSFVNYDIPSGKGIQFLNDMGLVMFTKYYLRIQRTIQQSIIDNPLRALTLGLTDNYLLGIQTIMDSSLLGHGGINFEWGALEYGDAVFQGIPMKMLGKIF